MKRTESVFERKRLRSSVARAALVTAVVIAASTFFRIDAAPQRGATPQPPPTPKAAAPIDLTGYWVAIVTEDWRWRMLTPSKGDYTSVPLNAEGRRVADTWDSAQEASNGCKPFGAAAIMRVPGRLHITWDGDTALKIETDAGRQTRLLRFDKTQKSGTEHTWQGYSVAEWETVGGRGDAVVASGGGAGRGAARPRGGSLHVVTTNVRAGYYRRNGVPYSENATMTEYFDRSADYGTEWLIVTTVVDDPQYLTQPFITSTHFKQEPDGSKWNPTPCE